MQRLEAVVDLSALSPISDDVIVACLRERFMTDHIYTKIGSSALVALNPHKYISSNSDSVLQKYAAEYRDTSEHKQPLPPHIFQLANNAYFHMKRTSQDQSIILRYIPSSSSSIHSRSSHTFTQRRNQQRKIGVSSSCHQVYPFSQCLCSWKKTLQARQSNTCLRIRSRVIR